MRKRQLTSNTLAQTRSDHLHHPLRRSRSWRDRLPASAMAFLAVLYALPAFAEELTLSHVVQLALSRNERSRIAGLGVEAADAAVSRARAAFLPTVTLAGTETLRPYSQEQGGRTVVRSNAANGSLTVSQPLVAVTAFPQYAAAKHGAASAQYNAITQRRLLCFDAARAFFGVIAAQRILTAAQRRLDRADLSFSDTQARAAAQLVSSNDVTRAQIERAKSVQSVASAQGSLQQARVSLELVLNAPLTGDLRTPDERLAPMALDIGQLTNQALAQRSDVGSAREDAASTAALADEPGLRFVPTLNVAGQGRVSDQQISGDRYYDTTLTLNLSWQIWDAGIRNADARSRKATADTAVLQLRAVQRRVSADVQSAVAALQAARASMKSAEEAVEAAQRGADETSVLYKQGLAKAIELVDANLSRFDAEVTLAAAQLGLRQAELDLRSALGLFPIDGVK